VLELCRGIVNAGLRLRWTCNSRVDFVDPELLSMMRRAGCWMVSWGIESGSQQILNNVRKGITLEKVERGLRWSKEAGIGNWGYFIIGLPGETEETIEQTIKFSLKLPLDIALFHIAVPYPGTHFYHEAIEKGWLSLSRWEDFDMDCSTVLSYPNLTAAQLEKAAKRAFRRWAMRPGPALTFLRSANSAGTLRSLLSIGVQHLGWIRG
jgi:radical SAM superfamily enzyme YgiQ (UPF0313 family)